MSTSPRLRWTLNVVIALIGALPGFWLGRATRGSSQESPSEHAAPEAPGARPRQAECLASLPMKISSVAPEAPGSPTRDGPGLRVIDGEQLRVTALGAPDDDQALVLVLDSEGLAHALWPSSGIAAPCPSGCRTLQVAIPASTLPEGPSMIAVYMGFDRFELPTIQDGLRLLPPGPMESKRLPMVQGARAAASQVVAHDNPPPRP